MDCADTVVVPPPFSQATTQVLRVGCQLGAGNAPALPAGFPPILGNPMAWTGAQFVDETEYVYQLSSFELAELADGLNVFKGAHLSDPAMSPKALLTSDWSP